MTVEPASQAGVSRLFLEGNAPLLLQGQDRAWLVEAGAVEVFAVELVNDQPAGPRQHVFTARQGCALLGLDASNDARTAFLAVGGGGAQVVSLPAGALSTGTGLAEAVNAWVSGLTSGLIAEQHT